MKIIVYLVLCFSVYCCGIKQAPTPLRVNLATEFNADSIRFIKFYKIKDTISCTQEKARGMIIGNAIDSSCFVYVKTLDSLATDSLIGLINDSNTYGSFGNPCSFGEYAFLCFKDENTVIGCFDISFMCLQIGSTPLIAAKERSYQGDLAAFGLQREAVRKMKAILDIKD